MIGMKLEKKKTMSITDSVTIYNKPKYIYIPLINGSNQDVIPFVKKGDYVKKGDVVAKTKGDMSIPIFSGVSGIVIDTVMSYCFNGKKVPCIQIENDFLDTQANYEPIPKGELTKETFVNLLHDKGIVGLGGSAFPTYVKYQGNNKIKTLIINAVECEPYITADYMLFKTKVEEVLEGIDWIMNIVDIDEAYIAIKVNTDELKELIQHFIGTYPKIKLIEVPNLYPMGWEKSLVQYIKHVDYKKLPIEKGIVVNNVSTIYAIYEALKYGKPLMERIVTFTGEMLKEPKNVLIKIGTPISEVIETIGYKRQKDLVFVAGGPMMGESLPTDELMATANLNCVLVLPFYENEVSKVCLRCGKCVQICPVKISPVLVKDSLKDLDELKKLKPERCIECGLCSYICPAKIFVREFVRQAKQNLRKEQSK